MEQHNHKGNNIGIFGATMEIDVSEHLPLLTLRSMPQKNALIELLRYFRGEDHVRWFTQTSASLWNVY